MNRATGRRVRAMIPVDLLGHPVDMDPLQEAADRFGLAVIEDATESLGAWHQGKKGRRPAGRLAEIACLSFNGNKLLTTGGGGMLVTDRADWAARARYLATQARDDALEYRHDQVGYNYRLPNLLAAVGLAQLEQLERFLAAKRAIAQRYEQGLADLAGVTLMRQAPWAESAWWLNTILVDPALAGLARRELGARLAQAGIATRPLWNPLHKNKAHEGAFAGDCEVATRLQDQALSLPSSVGLSEADQARVIAELRRALGGG
jgi:perosamine synthetase